MSNMTIDLTMIGTRVGDLRELPEELRGQLQLCATTNVEKQFLDVLGSLSNIANIDEIMVGVYRKYNVIMERAIVTNRLYRMYKSGLLVKIAGKKGVYKIK